MQADQKIHGRAGKYRWGAVSITGNFRENNEDRFLVDPAARFFLVADGMGGQSAGEKASALAVELISDRLEVLVDFQRSPSNIVIDGIDKSINHANAEIMALGELEPSCKNMGTTVTFIVVVKGEFFIGGVGDSRGYLLRNKKLQQLTEDHSLTQALVKAGTITAEDARSHRYRNVLYRYLGTKEGGSATDPTRLVPTQGDRFMLCSDGVSDGAPADMIEKVLNQYDDPLIAAEKLVAAAQQGGSKDNITCVVLNVE
ncbi:PP2C family protein-serine/threonine phosphatase [Planctomicrobium piriforme]|uniref:Protein phosphatase n=1 Tax=Planctomicrobium piriforme TaxID=1576369 RepID=A0A1I3C790_9PLAN|nr:protein phosphatase 2C domain-containing protein [Planctomicrobium piriforme]SFH70039.1 protein phosphatase [Planctomicrobium piriforme]